MCQNKLFLSGPRVLRVDPSGDTVILGIPREPLDFLNEARKLVHPAEHAGVLHSGVSTAIQKHCELSPLELLKCRQSVFSRALATIRSLSQEEAALRDKMPHHLATVLRGKRILFLASWLREKDHPDQSLCEDLANGFPLHGWLAKSHVFSEQWRPPALHPGELLRVASKQNKWILGSCKRSNQADIDTAVWDAILADVEKGWAVGPFSLEAARAASDKPLIVSRRCGVQQKNKVRAIDDVSASQVNACTGVKEKVRVESVDAAATMIPEWMRALRGAGRALVGRTYDLKSAYRQLGICEERFHAAWLAMFDPGSCEAKLFRMHALPFGASAAVTNFLRCAEALKTAEAHLLKFAWASFFDDFIVVCLADVAEDADKAVRLFFKLLGWSLASEPEKNKLFSPVFNALGVTFDLSRANEGILEISNTPSRKEELSVAINDVIASKRLSAKAADSLRSRLNFADARIFGRFAKRHCVCLANMQLRPFRRMYRRIWLLHCHGCMTMYCMVVQKGSALPKRRPSCFS